MTFPGALIVHECRMAGATAGYIINQLNLSISRIYNYIEEDNDACTLRMRRSECQSFIRMVWTAQRYTFLFVYDVSKRVTRVTKTDPTELEG
jgi:hypothetical protein